VRLELRWGGYDVDRIATLAKELVDLKPDAILGQTTPVISALARVTRTVPVVFVTVSDPIGSGFAANLAHPGAISQASPSTITPWAANGCSC
jgi:putative ABC transport system substrate-binding protein